MKDDDLCSLARYLTRDLEGSEQARFLGYDGPLELARGLLALNLEAYNTRYPEDPATDDIEVALLGFPGNGGLIYAHPVPTRTQAYRILGRWIYNCTEGSAPTTELFHWLDGEWNNMAHAIAGEFADLANK
ncbi:hypothetical protein [Oceanidesulfovibrio marinus]|nr:hypothetical protein [Oceanidesulfovibrio marinus]